MCFLDKASDAHFKLSCLLLSSLNKFKLSSNQHSILIQASSGGGVGVTDFRSVEVLVAAEVVLVVSVFNTTCKALLRLQTKNTTP